MNTLTQKEKFKITGGVLCALFPFLGGVSGFLFYLKTDAEGIDYTALQIGSRGLLVIAGIFLIAGIVCLKHSKRHCINHSCNQ